MMTVGDTCYTVDMTDTYGDGWNGGALDVYEDGVMVDSLTLASGNSGSTEYCGSEGASIEFYFMEGSWTVRLDTIFQTQVAISWYLYPQGMLLKQGLQYSRYMFDSSSGTDCDDTDAVINPDATEVCDGLDNDCNGDIDDGVLNMYYADGDGDGYGDSNPVPRLFTMVGTATMDGDCDDADTMTYPEAAASGYRLFDRC